MATETNKKKVTAVKTKKLRKYLFRIIALILAICYALFMIRENREYRYAGYDWMKIELKNVANDQIIEEQEKFLKENETSFDNMLATYKNELLKNKENFPYLRWKALEQVEVQHYTALVYTNKPAQAVYYPQKNVIVIWENQPSQNIGINQQLLIERLLDCITYNPKADPVLRYGIKASLRESFREIGVPISAHLEEDRNKYVYGIFLLEFLSQYISMNDLLFLWSHNYLEELVNSHTGGKYYEKLRKALMRAAQEENEKDSKRYVRIAQDVLVHFARDYSEAKGLPEEQLKKGEEFLLIKEDYFSDILNKK